MPNELVSGKEICQYTSLKYKQVTNLIIGQKLSLRYPKQILPIH